LGSSIGPGDTTFDVNMTAGEFPIAGILTIDTGANAENVEVESESGNMVTVIRDIGGNNTSHLSGVAVTESDLIHLNANGYQIVADAVAKYLSHYDNAAQH
jgi:lysophospholipase L1-like esterase